MKLLGWGRGNWLSRRYLSVGCRDGGEDEVDGGYSDNPCPSVGMGVNHRELPLRHPPGIGAADGVYVVDLNGSAHGRAGADAAWESSGEPDDRIDRYVVQDERAWLQPFFGSAVCYHCQWLTLAEVHEVERRVCRGQTASDPSVLAPVEVSGP